MSTANEAMERANSAHEKIDAHEDLCAERYAHIHTAIAGVKDTVGNIMKVLAWGGTTVFGLLIAALAFMATRSVGTNDNQINELKAQVAVLSAQQHR